MVVHEQGHDASAVSAVKLSEIDYPVKKRGIAVGHKDPMQLYYIIIKPLSAYCHLYLNLA